MGLRYFQVQELVGDAYDLALDRFLDADEAVHETCLFEGLPSQLERALTFLVQKRVNEAAADQEYRDFWELCEMDDEEIKWADEV